LAAACVGFGFGLLALTVGRLAVDDGRIAATAAGAERTGCAARLETDPADTAAFELTAARAGDESWDAARVVAGCRTVLTTVRRTLGAALGGASGSGTDSADAGGVSGPGNGVLVLAQAAAGVVKSNAHAKHHSPPQEPLGRSFDAHWDTAPPSFLTVWLHGTEVN
jgi:hypothetical protein